MTRDEMGAGSLLIAAPNLLDPNFRRTVVLLCDHGARGSLGLVLNRPLEAPLSRVFPHLANARVDAGLIHYGGPVEMRRMMALSRMDETGSGDGVAVLDGVSLVTDVDLLVEKVQIDAEPQRRYRFFLGYAGWGEEQLESELEQGAWIVRPGSTSLIFETPPARIWSEALYEMGGMFSLYSEMPLDPEMN